MNAADRLMLSRITAALDVGPFVDPVSVLGIAIPRKDARRFERELIAKFSARPVGSPAAVTAHNQRGGQSEQLNVSHFHEVH